MMRFKFATIVKAIWRTAVRQQPPERSAKPPDSLSSIPVAGVRSSAFISTSSGDVRAVSIPSTGRGYFLEVHGESFYQETLQEQWAKMRPDREWTVRLTAEPSNVHDPCAVAVQTFNGETVGYLPRAEAARYQQLFLQLATQGLVGICSARLVGGTKTKPSIGVFLDVDPPTSIAKKLGLTYQRVTAVGRP